MKKVLVLFSFLICFSAIAQHPGSKEKHPRMTHMEKPNFTPEQTATLRVKELTLMLDLSENQKTKIKALELATAIDRKARFENKELKKDMTDEDRFNHRSEMLDKKIAFRDSMKSILTEEQFQKWGKSIKSRGMRRHHKSRHGKKHEKKQ